MFLKVHSHCRDPVAVRRERRLVVRLGDARVVARDAGPRPGGDAQRHLPRVVQAAAPRRLARLAADAADAADAEDPV